MDLVPLQKKILEIMVYVDYLCKEHDIAYYLCGGSALGAVRHQGFIPWDDDLDIFMTHQNYIKFIDVCRRSLDKNRFYFQEENTKEWPLFFSKVRMNNTTYIEKFDSKKMDRIMHRGIYVDIFPLDSASDNVFLHYMQYIFSRLLIAKALGERGYITNSKLKKLVIFLSRIFIRGWLSRAMLCFIRSFNSRETRRIGSFFGKGKFNKISFPREYMGIPRYVKFDTTILPIPQKAEEYLKFSFGDYMKIPDKIEPSHAVYVDLSKGEKIS